MALGLLAEMAAATVAKDTIMYSSAISAFEKGHQWQLALGLLAEMAFVKVNKDVITYNAAISACAKGQQWQLALRLLAEMAFVKVDKDVIAYSAAISACEKGQQGYNIMQRCHQCLRDGSALGACLNSAHGNGRRQDQQ